MAARRCLRLRRKKEGHARRGRKAPRARRKRSLRYAKGGIACEGHGRAENAVGLGCVPTRSARISRARRKRDPACDVQLPSPARASRPRRKRFRPRLRATRSGRNPRAAGNEVAMRAIALAFCERPAGRRKCFRLRLRTNAFRENLPGAQEARPRVRRTTAVACEGLRACRKRGRRACPAFQRGKRRGAAPPGPQTFRAAAKQQSAALCRIAEGGASDFKCPFRRSRRFAARRARR